MLLHCDHTVLFDNCVLLKHLPLTSYPSTLLFAIAPSEAVWQPYNPSTPSINSIFWTTHISPSELVPLNQSALFQQLPLLALSYTPLYPPVTALLNCTLLFHLQKQQHPKACPASAFVSISWRVYYFLQPPVKHFLNCTLLLHPPHLRSVSDNWTAPPPDTALIEATLLTHLLSLALSELYTYSSPANSNISWHNSTLLHHLTFIAQQLYVFV